MKLVMPMGAMVQRSLVNVGDDVERRLAVRWKMEQDMVPLEAMGGGRAVHVARA